ncbi:hypothetical protein DW793_14360, partial [Ruminococcus sp. AM31-15AC]
MYIQKIRHRAWIKGVCSIKIKVIVEKICVYYPIEHCCEDIVEHKGRQVMIYGFLQNELRKNAGSVETAPYAKATASILI